MSAQGKDEEAKKVLISKGIEKAAKKKAKKAVKPKKVAKKKVTASKKRGGTKLVKRMRWGV